MNRTSKIQNILAVLLMMVVDIRFIRLIKYHFFYFDSSVAKNVHTSSFSFLAGEPR